MKKWMFATVLLVFATIQYGQAQSNFSSSEKEEIQDVGDYVAEKLLKSCSSWGGSNLYSAIDWDKVKRNSILGTLRIPMTVGWTGTITGNKYWIKGVFEIEGNGKKTWIKYSDSGGFQPGCSNNLSRFGIEVIR